MRKQRPIPEIRLVIGGVAYDTTTASKLYHWSADEDPRNFDHPCAEEIGTALFVNKWGAHFALYYDYSLDPWEDQFEYIQPLTITEAIQWLLDNNRKVRSTIITGYWKDTGNVADMLEVNRMVLEDIQPRVRGSVDDASEVIGRVVVEAGAQVLGSRIVGPAIIGTGTRVHNSYVGPFTSVAPGCVISDSEIEYSIVLRGASIQGVRRIEASFIGHDVEVSPSPKVPRTHRLVLGDHSKVQISS